MEKPRQAEEERQAKEGRAAKEPAARVARKAEEERAARDAAERIRKTDEAAWSSGAGRTPAWRLTRLARTASGRSWRRLTALK